MSVLRVLSRAGDTKLEWDTLKARSGDPEAEEAVRQAEELFRQEQAKGATAFKVGRGVPATRIDEFDPEAEQIVMVPRVAGG